MTHLCLLFALSLGIGKYSQSEHPQNHTEATAAGCGRKIRLGLDTYLVSLSEQPQASHSLPRTQSPAQGLSSSPPSVELEGWFGSWQTEDHQMRLPVSCDCRKQKREGGINVGIKHWPWNHMLPCWKLIISGREWEISRAQYHFFMIYVMSLGNSVISTLGLCIDYSFDVECLPCDYLQASPLPL